MDENTQAKFDAKLKELLAVAKKKKNVLEYQEINDFFKDMPLEEEQFERILELLEQNNVDVLRITDDDDDLPDDDLLLVDDEEMDMKILIFLYRTASESRILSECTSRKSVRCLF